MKSILIVDDEAPIREWLEMCVEQAGPEYKVVGPARNSKEAISVIADLSPDIVFTDITMPGRDGLELLKEIQDSFSKIKVVILTCHSNFDFARTALKYGSFDYFLKSELKKEVIFDLLEKLSNIIDGEREEFRKNQKEFDIVVRGHYLRNLIETGKTSLTSKDLNEYKINIADLPYFAVSFSYNKKAVELLQHNYKDFLANQIIFFYSRANVVFVSNLTCESDQCEFYVNSLLNDFKKECKGNIGNSNIYVHSNALIKAINEAISMKEYLFYNSGEAGSLYGSITDSKDFKEFCNNTIENEKVIKTQLVKYKNQIVEFLKVYGKDSSCASFQEMISYIINNKIYDVDFVVYSICDILERMYNNAENNKIDIKKVKNDIIFSENIEVVKKVIENFYLDLNIKEKYLPNILKVVDYIRSNYHKHITLKDVAEIACLNEEYFSRLFKKEVGTNFTGYLNKIRMDTAEKLIKTTDFNINEIAIMVGIPNSAYFSTVFKKYFKESPSAMRDKIS